jgi:hypothetical protein
MVEVRIIEMEPPSRDGALHISVARRKTEPHDPVPGEALQLLRSNPAWRDRMRSTDPVESSDGGSLRAFADCVGPEGQHWDFAVFVGRSRAIISTYNTADPASPERAMAQQIVLSLANLDG